MSLNVKTFFKFFFEGVTILEEKLYYEIVVGQEAKTYESN